MSRIIALESQCPGSVVLGVSEVPKPRVTDVDRSVIKYKTLSGLVAASMKTVKSIKNQNIAISILCHFGHLF